MSIKKVFLFYFLSFSVVVFSQENIIINLKVEGAKKTKRSFVCKLLETKKGLVLDSLSLERDMILLKRLPAISHASYRVTHYQDNYYKVSINLEENLTLLPSVNLWTTTNKQFSYKLGLYDYNFLGKNITFGGFYQNNGFNSYGVNLKAPNLLLSNLGLAVSHQNWKSEEPLYFDDKSANYLYNNISFEVLALYQINLKNQLNFGVNIFNEKYQYLSGHTNTSIPQNLDLDKTLFKLVYTFDNLDYYYQYIQGFKSTLYLQYVTSNNSFQSDFFIAWNDFFYYRKMWKKGTWANRLRFGLSTNEKTPFAPFALDNNVNLRGVGILVDRGTGVALWNTEYRYTVYDKKWLAILTNVFSDFGSWRNPGNTFNDFFKSENLRIYSGVGLRFISKKVYNATFRIDYGFRISNNPNQSKGGLVFGIGQYF